MMTEAGKVQAASWNFGAYDLALEHANQAVETPDPIAQWLQNTMYATYQKEFWQQVPELFTKKMDELNPGPTSDEVIADPKKAVFTYLRGYCNRCHVSGSGMQQAGDYRGKGCSACHVPYSITGQYYGHDATLAQTPASQASDKSASPRRPSYPALHTIHSTAQHIVQFAGKKYSGIPVSTCNACHYHSSCIGTTYQGLIESPYPTTWDAKGQPPSPLHGRYYMPLAKDVHYAKGMLCQDCHTTLDVHGTGTLARNMPGAVEIECQDCHGTPTQYPWELPLGVGDEYERALSQTPRGLAQEMPPYLLPQTEVQEGYLLSARGNPLANGVKKGNKAIFQLANGTKQELKLLKSRFKAGALSRTAEIAMVQITKHIERLECYACHSNWAPQFYGRNIQIQFGEEYQTPDWVTEPETPTYQFDQLSLPRPNLPAKIIETLSYVRWEDPILVRNAEARIGPGIPNTQASITILSKGQTVWHQKILRFDLSNAPVIGMIATFPHTTQKKARSCQSCHSNPKTIGYGIDEGLIFGDLSQDFFAELSNTQDQPMFSQTPQVNKIPGMFYDWSQLIGTNGKPLQTVSRQTRFCSPLTIAEQQHIQRQGVCTACHQELPDYSIGAAALQKIGKAINMLPTTDAEHSALLQKSLLLTAWVQILGIFLGIAFTIAVAYLWIQRKKKKAKKS